MSIIVHQVGILDTNCIILSDKNSKECVIVDPGGNPEQIIASCKGYNVKYILMTHGHFDHILFAPFLFRKFSAIQKDAPILMLQKEDDSLYNNLQRQCLMFGISLPKDTLPLPNTKPIIHGQGITIGNDERVRITFVHTPGHSLGSCSFFITTKKIKREKNENMKDGEENIPILCSGDTLFRWGIGRTDLPGGSFHSLIKSVISKLYTLPDDTIVIPGHGPTTTIEKEKRNNPFVNINTQIDEHSTCSHL